MLNRLSYLFSTAVKSEYTIWNNNMDLTLDNESMTSYFASVCDGLFSLMSILMTMERG